MRRVGDRCNTPGARRSALRRRWPAVLPLLLLAVVAPVASGGSAGAAVCGDEFTGPSKGKWNVAENWEPGLPTSSTIVCWAAEKTVVAEGVDTADSILIGGTLDTNGAEITLAN